MVAASASCVIGVRSMRPRRKAATMASTMPTTPISAVWKTRISWLPISSSRK